MYGVNDFLGSLDELDARLDQPSATCRAYQRAVQNGEVEGYAGTRLERSQKQKKDDDKADGNGVKPDGNGVKPDGNGVKLDEIGIRPCLDAQGI
jgi:hypothetical protein